MTTHVEAQEAAQEALLAELGALGAHDLCGRLAACRSGREALRASGGKPHLEQVVAGRRYRCRSYACWSCRRQRVRRDARHYAEPFRDAMSDDCSMITIADSLTGDLDVIRDRVTQIRRALRDRRDATASRRPRWRAVELVGYCEPDGFSSADAAVLLPDQRALVARLPVVTGAMADGPMWVIRVHLAVHHPGIERAELEYVLRQQWPINGAVQIKEFEGALAAEDAGNILSYGAKHRFRVVSDLIEEDAEWPISWQAAFWSMIDQNRRGMQIMRIALGPMKNCHHPSTSSSDDDVDNEEDGGVWDEPMPFIAGW